MSKNFVKNPPYHIFLKLTIFSSISLMMPRHTQLKRTLSWAPFALSAGTEARICTQETTKFIWSSNIAGSAGHLWSAPAVRQIHKDMQPTLGSITNNRRCHWKLGTSMAQYKDPNKSSILYRQKVLMQCRTINCQNTSIIMPPSALSSSPHHTWKLLH